MQERTVSATGRAGRLAVSERWRDPVLLGLLLVLTVALRVWLLCHTEVAARDSIGFIRYALQFENQPWTEVLRNNHQHPGYPLTVLAMSLPVRHFLGTEPGASAMQLSAQLASSLAAVLLLLPMYYLGKAWFSRSVGFWAVVFFQCLPVSGHVLSDGLSEALFLLLSATTLLFATYALQRKSLVWFGLCGGFCGLTYLTRPEGALLLVATGMALIWLQAVPRWRLSWPRTMTAAATMVFAALIVGCPYFLATEGFTNKPSAQKLLARGETGPAGLYPSSAPWAVVVQNDGTIFDRSLEGIWEMGSELAKAFHYVFWIPALAGMWWNRHRVWDRPGMLVVLILCALHSAILLRLIVVVGYLSDRHLLILVLGGVYPAASALLELPYRLSSGLRRWHGIAVLKPVRGYLLTGALAWTLLLAIGLISTALPRTLKPLHGNRAGHHAAGLWLAEHARPADVIEDSHCWAHYYAGRVFLEGQAVARPAGPVTRYTVVGRGRERERDQGVPGSRMTEETLRRQGGALVYHWPPGRPVERAEVVVYAAPLVR
jgi:hypothetical protein